MTEQEEQDRHTEIDIIVANQRGNFIHLMIVIESMMEDIIKHHYCKEAVRDEFMYSVLTKENFSFSTKHQLLCFILQNNYNIFYHKNQDCFQNLAKLIEDRNHFAHRKFFSANPLNYQGDKTSFFFEHYKTESHKPLVKKIEYNQESFKRKLMQISETTHKFLEIYKMMGIDASEITKYYK